jgi:hypothetical protein
MRSKAAIVAIAGAVWLWTMVGIAGAFPYRCVCPFRDGRWCQILWVCGQ